MLKFTYPAIKTRQTSNGNEIILFTAPVTEIRQWAGIPQKKGKDPTDSSETVGFQRDDDYKRVNEIKKFYSNSANTIQNPLLIATRNISQYNFEDVGNSSTSFSKVGTIKFEFENLESLSLIELMKKVKEQLELRIPELKNKKIENKKIIEEQEELDESDLASDDELYETEDPFDENFNFVFSEQETHIEDFWEELSIRIETLQNYDDEFTGDSFRGFTKDAMLSFLKPTVIVDGQHRLLGALADAQYKISTSEELKKKIEKKVLEDNVSPEIAQTEVEKEMCRWLPISLLITDKPEEHVFQFVVVNQKATPLKKSLLGTIISTSLSNDELKGVTERLTNAGIKLEEARYITFFARNDKSPFYNLIERGLPNESNKVLAWSVISSLIKIFQELEGGKLFGENLDHAKIWRKKLLDDSPIIDKWDEDDEFETPYDYWKSENGPWMNVFMKFWTIIKSEFSSDDEDSYNYWGSPRKSNLFNKISLTILAADFFQFLHTRRRTIGSVESIEELISDWLEGVDRSYFSRDWKIKDSGVKKDSTAVRNLWAKIWSDYRVNPERLPSTSRYTKTN